ncbi:type VI secretion system tip protein VgrG [Mucilaginibacter jinjuensis]|uniref:Type VI secretion system tip protein VgrG n=1 Tax=Mucilaginibacter jinjuensis TaxID=1176721 RepID=A0ABY7T0R7_9SPHI|nr:type VI secretion system tip protein VgrG [Mucilaginibacter jinjuensis]WCT10019.1 type VI secretion system tip protein VgrG [Mucilaginibacter jinjuensis]
MAAAGRIGGLVTFTVKVAGNAVPDTVQIHAVHVEKRVNKISIARITILDGEADEGNFTVSSSSTFVPGAEVTIEAGYDSTNALIFKGIITAQTIRIDNLIGSALEVECRDSAIKMIVGRKNLTFSKQKDSDVMSSIIRTYSGLTASVTATTTQWPEQVQYYVTDWDFVLSRAEANGMIVTVSDGTVSVIKPDANTTSVLTITYGIDLLEFNAQLNAVTQLGSVKASSWDFITQAVATASSANNLAGPGNLSSKTLSNVVGLSEFQVQTTAPLQSADLTDWAKAQLIKSEYSKIIGEAKFQGSSLVLPGNYITLAGLGDRFNGDHLVSAVVHDISDGNWNTETSIGLPNTWFIEEPDVMSPPNSGVLPAARGLINGTVKQMSEDPDGQFRILVNVQMFDISGQGIWARLSNFYSTSGAGAFFLPEVGDEVVLGFLNEDPRYPVILGSMYSSSQIKPYSILTPNDKNSLKSIVSKSGIYVEFNDTDKILTINTPNKNTMIYSDKDKSITIQDQNSNSIVMSSDGITMKSNNNINIQAAQKVNIKGDMGITIQSSSGDVAISGLNVKETAQMEYSAEGSMTAKISSGMQMTLKSAMIMIN